MSLDKVQFEAGLLNAPYGEPPKRVRCPANGDTGEWLDRYIWTPGNQTRYDLMYGCRMSESRDHDDAVEFVLVYVNPFGRPPKALIFREPTLIHYSYVVDKLPVNEADCWGILTFLERMGHEVALPPEMDKVYRGNRLDVKVLLEEVRDSSLGVDGPQ